MAKLSTPYHLCERCGHRAAYRRLETAWTCKSCARRVRARRAAGLPVAEPDRFVTIARRTGAA